MKCKVMKHLLKQREKEAFQQARRIRELERRQVELSDEVSRLKAGNASEISWNHLRITVRTEFEPMIAYHYDARELCLEVGSGNDKIAYKQFLVTAFDLINQDRAAFIKGIGEQMAIAVLKAEAAR